MHERFPRHGGMFSRHFQSGRMSMLRFFTNPPNDGKKRLSSFHVIFS